MEIIFGSNNEHKVKEIKEKISKEINQKMKLNLILIDKKPFKMLIIKIIIVENIIL